MSKINKNNLNIFLLLLSWSILSIFPALLLADDIIDIPADDSNISPNNTMRYIFIIGTIILVAYLFSFQEGPSDTALFIPDIPTKDTIPEINLPKIAEPAKNTENTEQLLAFLEKIGSKPYENFITKQYPNNK